MSYYEPPINPPDAYSFRTICESCGEESTVAEIESLAGGCPACFDQVAPCGEPVAQHHWEEDCYGCYMETN